MLWIKGMSLAGVLYHYSPRTIKLSPGAAPSGQPLVFSANISFSGIIDIMILGYSWFGKGGTVSVFDEDDLLILNIFAPAFRSFCA